MQSCIAAAARGRVYPMQVSDQGGRQVPLRFQMFHKSPILNYLQRVWHLTQAPSPPSWQAASVGYRAGGLSTASRLTRPCSTKPGQGRATSFSSRRVSLLPRSATLTPPGGPLVRILEAHRSSPSEAAARFTSGLYSALCAWLQHGRRSERDSRNGDLLPHSVGSQESGR